MKIALFFLLPLLMTASGFAQTLGEVDTRVSDYGVKKFDQADKRIYLTGFNVHYQVYFSATDSQGSKKTGGAFRAGSRVSAAVGLAGIPEAELVRITDEMYDSFRQQLEAAGYTFLDADAAAGIDAYGGWARVAGGTVSRAEVDGYVTVNPSGNDYFVPRIKDSGKRAKKFFDNTPQISDQLEDAIIAKVDIYVPFAEDGESGFSRSMGRMTDESKVVLRTRMRLGSPTVIQQTGLKALAGNFGNSGPPAATQVSFVSGKIPVGTGADAQYNVQLGKDLEIMGVMNDEKIKRYAKGSMDFTPQAFGSLSYYEAETQEVDDFIQVDFDVPTYLQGARSAGTAYLEAAVAGFLAKAK